MRFSKNAVHGTGSNLVWDAKTLFKSKIVCWPVILPSSKQVVREVLPSQNYSLRINIDATQIGNVARFFNHR